MTFGVRGAAWSEQTHQIATFLHLLSLNYCSCLHLWWISCTEAPESLTFTFAAALWTPKCSSESLKSGAALTFSFPIGGIIMENSSTGRESTTAMTDCVSHLQVCPFVRQVAKNSFIVTARQTAWNYRKWKINVFFFCYPVKINVSVTQKPPVFLNSVHFTGNMLSWCWSPEPTLSFQRPRIQKVQVWVPVKDYLPHSADRNPDFL